PIPRVAFDEARDVALVDPREVVGAGRANLTQEQANERQMAHSGRDRQTAFLATIDAIACNPQIAQSVRDAGADYLLAVKGNQPTLQADIEAAFEAADKGQVEIDV